MSERVADVLLIGSMKSGTTTLFDDLCAQAGIAGADPKEPEHLMSDRVLTPAGRRAYAAVFRGCDPGALWLDGSTGYTKLPLHPGVAERAAAVLPEGFRAIYIMREPVARVISHHAHMYSASKMGPDIDACVREHPEMIDWTRYAMQARAWLDVIGPERLLLLRFEDYIRDRAGTVEQVCAFLGVACDRSLIDAERVSNRSEGKAAHNRLSLALASNPLYRRVRRSVPVGVRERLKRAVMSESRPAAAPPSLETVERVLDAVADDHRELAGLMGLDGPVWRREDGLKRARAGGASDAAERRAGA